MLAADEKACLSTVCTVPCAGGVVKLVIGTWWMMNSKRELPLSIDLDFDQIGEIAF
jgi:hypothetical protein